MFADAIEKVSQFTRLIMFATRNYGDVEIQPGAATLFFVNDDGWALTCAHVARDIELLSKIDFNHFVFRAEKDKLHGTEHETESIITLEEKFGMKKGFLCQALVIFQRCVNHENKREIIKHPTLDLALIHFTAFDKKAYTSHAVFAKDDSTIRQGDYLCRLGFPFPEFSCFKYDPQKESIVINAMGKLTTPQFPLDGMVTRFITDKGLRVEIELSTPGLKGQSGGPLFDKTGTIWGVQAATAHLHLGFDIENKEMILEGKKKVVHNQPFLHVGRCVSLNIIKEFLGANGVTYFIRDNDGSVIAVQKQVAEPRK